MAIQDHNLQITEQQYRDLELPSYSMCAAIDKQGIDVVGGTKTVFDLKFGSLVDMMCFEHHRVDDVFYKGVSTKPPTTNVKQICDYILQNLEGNIGKEGVKITPLGRRKSIKISNKLSSYRDEILHGRNKCAVYKNYSDDKVVETVVKAGSQYFKDKITARGKILIKPEMWDLASQTAATLITHPFTAKYFQTNVPGIEIIYQYKAKAIVNGYEVKVMLDCLVVNHKAKLIIPVDLKTGEYSCKEFPMYFTSYRYHLQGGLYRSVLQSIVDSDFDLMGYTVKEFEFVYISKLNPSKPMRFLMNDDIHEAAWQGFTDRHGFQYKGLNELLGEYYYSVQNDKAQYTAEEMTNKGLVVMNNKMILG